MGLKQKIMIGAALLAVLPVLVTGLVVIPVLTNASHEALEVSAEQRLVAARNLTKGPIEDYFWTIRHQVLTLSNNRMIRDAVVAFTDSFSSYTEDTSHTKQAGVRVQLASYYTDEFSSEYRRRNQDQSVDVGQWLQQLDAESLALQYRFIKNNPNPLGENTGWLTLEMGQIMLENIVIIIR